MECNIFYILILEIFNENDERKDQIKDENNKQLYHSRGWQMKGSLGKNICFCFFPDTTWWSFSYMVVYDLMCDKDFNRTKNL